MKLESFSFPLHDPPISPLISAIVLNFRTPLDTVKCVHALLKQTAISQMEILVVDNHSEDDSIGSIRNRLTHPQVHILEARTNGGYGRGNNIAMRQARGQYILVTNPDNELPPDAVEKMLHTMEKDSSIGILAPRLMHEDGSVRESARTFPHLSDVIIKRTFLNTYFPARMDRYLRRSVKKESAHDVDWVVGACLLIRRDLLEEIGLFDERFFLFFEDIDLCRRCWNARKRVHYDPTLTVSDKKERLSEGGVFRMMFRMTGRAHIVSALRYFWKWRGQAVEKI